MAVDIAAASCVDGSQTPDYIFAIAPEQVQPYGDGCTVLYPFVMVPAETFSELVAADGAGASASPFNLSTEDGAYISALIMGVWATAWAIKAVSRAITAPASDTSD